MNNISQIIRERLFALSDKAYAEFSSGLIPNIDAGILIGVRMPALRAVAKTLSTHEQECFIGDLPHKFHEENMLHAIIINNMSAPELTVSALDTFLPWVDNWAVCDCLRPVSLKKRPEELLALVRRHINSEHTYSIRFAVEMLMSYFLDELFLPEYPEMVAKIQSDDYYVNMMLAWYFATALAKRWEEIVPYIEMRSLTPWVHNKTIQKARESYRIDPAQKEYLKSLRI